jgi:hypothetical protein
MTGGAPKSNKRKSRVNDIAFGSFGVYVDRVEHTLILEFIGPSECTELDCKRVVLKHKVSLHEVEYFYGQWDKSDLTRSVVMDVLNRFLGSKLVADYRSGGLAPDVVDFHRKVPVEDEYGDMTTLSFDLVRYNDITSII